ncbi:guanine nucleotide exchange protein smcr8b [Myxocyprinus asiaticus]|uniref:guanine nucleotide exchange protein smcr8b n=1 Tax=Myxocyprinus asiaticus TaxID=70543 RepID=UPI0022232F0F|nr:guanine nucleotide exchange protein smcr8b [Myxocyprinus asiaticus]
MIGSPDLFAFTKETDFREIPTEPSALPEELSVPMYTYSGNNTPWSKISSAKFKKDFILISEFSEQVGPQPLLTVPPETKACGTFDLNHFSLRIMSVDYQTCLTGSGGCSSPKLNFVEDSKVVLGDSGEGAFAYVHHLTLYDLEARGFVRPLCLAYVSSDENKIIQQFQQLSTEFSKVSECLKTGNRKNFANELEKKLRDLEYTRVVLLGEIERENLNDSFKYTNEREQTLNSRPILKGDAEDLKLKDKSLLFKDEVKLQEKDGCELSREKVETKNCTLSETVSNNRLLLINCEVEGTMNKYEQDKQFEKLKKRKDKEKGYWSMPLTNKAEELASVHKSIQEHKSLLKQVTSYPTRKLRESEISSFEPDDLPHSLELDLDDLRLHSQLAGPMLECNVFSFTNTPLHSPELINCTPARRFDRRLKTLEELCDKYFHQQALQQLHSIERTFRGDGSHIYANQLCQNLLRNLKSTNFLFEDPYDLEEGAEFQPGMAGHHVVHQPSFLTAPSILSEPVSLESYTSCVEMVPIKLELGGSSHSAAVASAVTVPSKESLPPTPKSSPVETDIADEGVVSALDYDCNGHDEENVSAMKTSISSGDSIEVLGTEKSFRTQGSSIPMYTAPQRPPPLTTTAGLEGLRQGRVPTRRTYSGDSIEVLSMTDSILPEDLRALYPCAIDEESPEQETDEKDRSQNQESEQVKECPFGVGIAASGEKRGVFTEGFYPAFTLTPPDCPMTLTPAGSNSQDVCSALELIPFPLLEEPCRTVRDDLSDCFSFRSTTASTPSDCTFFVYHHGDKREGLTRRRRGQVGRAALKFLQQFPFAVHAAFSLLSGQTLVVLGSEEATVRKLVKALSIYTPHVGRFRETIQPWTSMPLQLTDLLNWKLIGFNRMCSLTHSLPHCLGHYSRYISVLDLDQKTLRCPTYSGTLISQLVDPRSHIIRGNTYFLFVQQVLSKLVTRAFLLTFSHSLHSPRNPHETIRTEHFHSILHRDDKKIVIYLSELIKLYYMEVPPNVLRFSYTKNSLFKL